MVSVSLAFFSKSMFSTLHTRVISSDRLQRDEPNLGFGAAREPPPGSRYFCVRNLSRPPAGSQGVARGRKAAGYVRLRAGRHNGKSGRLSPSGKIAIVPKAALLGWKQAAKRTLRHRRGSRFVPRDERASIAAAAMGARGESSSSDRTDLAPARS